MISWPEVISNVFHPRSARQRAYAASNAACGNAGARTYTFSRTVWYASLTRSGSVKHLVGCGVSLLFTQATSFALILKFAAGGAGTIGTGNGVAVGLRSTDIDCPSNGTNASR